MNVVQKLAAIALGIALLASLATGCARRLPEHWPVSQSRADEIRKGLAVTGAGGGETAAARPDPQGFGTLKGTFRFDAAAIGGLPAPTALKIDGDDAAFCAREAKPMNQSLLFDKSSGAIENVVIFMAEDLSKVDKPELWVAPSAAPGKNEPFVFDQDRCMFLAHVSALQISQPMLIKNSDGVGHNTKLENSNPDSKIIPPGGEIVYQHRKQERAPYKVSCNIHPWMTAWVLPRDNSYFDITGKEGTFEIPELPAGVPLLMKVWHEKVGMVEKVTVNGKAVKWPKKGFQLDPIPTGGELTLDVVFDAEPFK
jgi:hypothetical protein